MNNLFSVMEGAQCVTWSRGVFKQVAVYARLGEVYAKHGSGYIKLQDGKRTSHPDVRWYELEGVNYKTHINKVMIDEAE